MRAAGWPQQTKAILGKAGASECPSQPGLVQEAQRGYFWGSAGEQEGRRIVTSNGENICPLSLALAMPDRMEAAGYQNMFQPDTILVLKITNIKKNPQTNKTLQKYGVFFLCFRTKVKKLFSCF